MAKRSECVIRQIAKCRWGLRKSRPLFASQATLIRRLLIRRSSALEIPTARRLSLGRFQIISGSQVVAKVYN